MSQPNYSESVFFQTEHYAAVLGFLMTWAAGSTPEIYVKSKNSNHVMQFFGRQSMTPSDIENSKQLAIKKCKELESLNFG